MSCRSLLGAVALAVAGSLSLVGCAGSPNGGAAGAGTQQSPAPQQSPGPQPASPTPGPSTAAAVTVHPLATQAAMDVLGEGGSAADAAFTVAAVLTVIEPYFSNVIAGETSLLHHDGATGRIRSQEAVGPVGSDFDLAAYQSRGHAGFGLYQALVPGAWDGWVRLLEAEGKLELDRLLEPAITLARDGHEATAATGEYVPTLLQSDAVNGPARAIFAPGGDAVSEGETLRQPQLAASLQGIVDAYATAGERRSGLTAAQEHVYTGELGQRLTTAAREGGAVFTAQDMADYASRFHEPITLDYEGHTVHQNPPPTQGVTMLTALNTLEAAQLSPEDADSPETAHTMIEAVKLAMADREAYVGDPEFGDVPVEELVDPAYGQRQLARIDQDSAMSWPIRPGLEGDTTTYQIVDHDGDAVAVTTSIGLQLIAAGDTGVMMNNRMRFMTTDPNSPNFLEAGKRVRYTGNPYMVTGPDGLRLLGGNIGADTQSQVQTQHVVNVLSFGMSAQEAIARHRFMTQYHPNSIAPHAVNNRVRIESSTPGTVVAGLRERGQNVELTSGAGPFGYGSMIELQDGGRDVSIATEPRVPTSTGDTDPPA